jgi:hypothetical protein
MNLFRNNKIVLLAAILISGMALAPYAHAMSPQHHSMEMSDCSASMDCLACANSLPASTRIDHSLYRSLDATSSYLIPKVDGPAVSHYHPPG